MGHSVANQVDNELILLSISVVGFLLCKIRKPKKGSSVPLTDPEIREAKKWYDNTYQAAEDTTLSKPDTEKYASDWSKKFKPDWQGVKKFNECGTTIIEIPAIKNGEMTLSFSRPDVANVEFNKSGTVTSLLIVKRKMDFNLYAMTVVASAAHLKANYGRLGNNTYQKKEKDFEGAVFFNKMDGSFVNGWRFQNGEATRELFLSRTNWARMRLAGKKYKNYSESSPDRSSLTTVALWEDHIYRSESPIAYHCNTYITTNVYADCPISEGITIAGGINETLAPSTAPYGLPSRFLLEQELHHLKVGVRNLN